MWRMCAAAVDMHAEIICDLAEELQGTCSSEGIVRAAGMAQTFGFGYRFTEVRESRGGPGDPRRVPSRRVDLISAPASEVHCVRAGGLNVPPSG